VKLYPRIGKSGATVISTIPYIFTVNASSVRSELHYLFNKINRPTNFYKIIFIKKLYMFQAVPLPIIRSFALYIRHWYMSCMFDDSL